MGFFDFLGSNIMNALSWVMQFLPNSPFQAIHNSEVDSFIAGLNWILPMDKIIVELELWLSCVTIYYAYQIILRWIKAVE